MSDPRSLQCYRCLGFGHLARACRGVDRGKLCFRLGRAGHLARACEFATSCVLCGERGASSDHKLGSRYCAAIIARALPVAALAPSSPIGGNQGGGNLPLIVEGGEGPRIPDIWVSPVPLSMEVEGRNVGMSPHPPSQGILGKVGEHLRRLWSQAFSCQRLRHHCRRRSLVFPRWWARNLKICVRSDMFRMPNESGGYRPTSRWCGNDADDGKVVSFAPSFRDGGGGWGRRFSDEIRPGKAKAPVFVTWRRRCAP